jgi:hypothetical protein
MVARVPSHHADSQSEVRNPLQGAAFRTVAPRPGRDAFVTRHAAGAIPRGGPLQHTQAYAASDTWSRARAMVVARTVRSLPQPAAKRCARSALATRRLGSPGAGFSLTWTACLRLSWSMCAESSKSSYGRRARSSATRYRRTRLSDPGRSDAAHLRGAVCRPLEPSNW